MFLDKLIIEIDKAVKTIFAEPVSRRPHPDQDIPDTQLSDSQKKHVQGLMRINHCGEICAQGLYQGQALTARDKSKQQLFNEASFEETEHLAWTNRRIKELGSYTSILNPLFYLGSLAIGVSAGILGDKWSLGFLEETEHQVGRHLDEHLDELPEKDLKSRAILSQMKEDEAKHAKTANECGANELPTPVKTLMHLMSKVMKNTTYYI